MKLIEMTLTGFVDTTASDAPAPGGGSVSALAGALGAALTSMVCALTLGKKKYADVQDLAAATEKQAIALKDRYLISSIAIPKRLTRSARYFPCRRKPMRIRRRAGRRCRRR